MKNTRSYRLPALLLAVIMAFGALPVTATAADYYPTWIYSYTPDNAIITFTSGGNTVSSVNELVPGQANTMTIVVPNSEGLPQDTVGLTLVSVPENLKVTADDAAKCDGTGVSCTYRPSTNQLAFRWTGTPQEGFTATLPVTPDTPSTVNLGGRYVIVGVKDGGSLAGVVKAQAKNATQLNAPQVKTFDGKLIFDDNSYYIWTFTRVSGDWYTISNGEYLRMDGEAIKLTDKANATIFHIRQEAMGYVIESNGYYLNIKSNYVKGSNWSPINQWMKLYSPSEVVGEDAAEKGYIKLNANGGNKTPDPEMLSAEFGSTVTLPNYTGTVSGKRFFGWAEVKNIRQTDPITKLYRYYDVYLPGAQLTITDGMKNLYAVWMTEGGEDVEFGIKKDGQIPYEPGNYPTAGYTSKKVKKSKALIDAMWVVDPDATKAIEGNHVSNAVTANLRDLPTDEEIKGIYSEYDPETMHVLWYVIKWMGKWKVDGVVIKNAQTISVMYYPTFTGNDVKNVFDLPQGYKLEGSTKIIIGKEKNGKTPLTPYRDGYTFLGWATTADGSGTIYQSGEEITVDGNISFYAQWEKIPTYKVSFSLNNADRNAVEELPEDAEYRENSEIEIPEAEERHGYIFSGWMVNGEKINNGSIIMPENDVEITGTYYGPIDIDIVSDWPNGKTGYFGATITLTANVTCKEDLEYTLQWQYSENGNWVNVPGANGLKYSYILDKETSGRIWRVIVTDAKPKQ